MPLAVNRIPRMSPRWGQYDPFVYGGLFGPSRLPGYSGGAHYDAGDLSTLMIDSSNRVSLWADKSGNSATNCLVLNGVSGNDTSSPYIAAYDANNLDCDIDCTPAAFGATMTFMGMWNNTKWIWQINASRQPILAIDVGAGAVVYTSTVASSFAAFVRQQHRVTRNATTGAVTFYTRATSTDSWAVLDTVVGSTGTLRSVSSSIRVGSNAGTSQLFSGVVYTANYRTAIDGTPVYAVNFTTTAKLATSFTESSVNAATVTINTTGDTGARISGARDLYQGTVSKQPVLLRHTGDNYGYLNGVSGNSISTPDNASFAAATALDVRVWVAPSDVTTLGFRDLFSQYNSAGNKRCWSLANNNTSAKSITLFVSALGTDSNAATSSVDFPLVVGTGIGIRATWRASDQRTQFFYRSDLAGMSGSTGWTQVGANATMGGAVASLFDSDAAIIVGGKVDQTTNYPGRYQYADARVVIDGAPVVVFDASRYVSGTTLTASTGETWTVNGGATIVTRTCVYGDGSDDYMKSAAFSLSQPETVYFVGQQVSWTASDCFFDGGSNASLRLNQFNSSPTLEFYTGGGASAQTSALVVGATGVIACVGNSTNSTIRLNRGASSSASMSGTAANGFTLGSRGDGGATWANMTASEIAIYAAAHTTLQQDRFAIYAGRKWRITV